MAPIEDRPRGFRILQAGRELGTEVYRWSGTELDATPAPRFIVQGTTDIQIMVADAERLHAARPDARILVIPGANHLFVADAGTDAVAQAASYTDPTLPVVPELVPALADFITRGPPGTR